MLRLLELILEIVSGVVADSLRSRQQLLAEKAMFVSRSSTCGAPSNGLVLTPAERLLLVISSCFTKRWRRALHIVQPDTLLRWHRDLFRLRWRFLCRAVHADILDDSRRVVGLTSLHCASEEPHREDVLRAGWTTVEREFPSSDTLLESPATAGSKHYAHAEQVAPRLASSRATRARVRASSS